MEQAITSQIRQVLLDLASMLSRPTEDIERVQNELSELELDLAMLDSEVAGSTDPELQERRETVTATVTELQGAVADAFRELFEVVTDDRRRAPTDALGLFAELDELVEHYRGL